MYFVKTLILPIGVITSSILHQLYPMPTAGKHKLFPLPVEHSTIYYNVIQIVIMSGCGFNQSRPHLSSPSCDAGCGQMFITCTVQAAQVRTAVFVVFNSYRVNSLRLDVKCK